MKPAAAFLARNDCPFVGQIYDAPRRTRIAQNARLLPTVLTPDNLEHYRREAAETEILFTCWAFPYELLTPDQFPSLKLVLYSGGSVKGFARPLLERGIQVVGARAANAIAVAHFCLGQIILSAKGYFRNTRDCRDAAKWHAGSCYKGPGLYGEKVALLGMGAVALELAPLLQQCDLKVLAMDPYLTTTTAAELDVTLVTMEEAFATAYIVSNHLPNLSELKGVIDRKLLSSMRPGATFINTGRGAQVNEDDLIAVCRERPDLTSLLDVLDPEPAVVGSPLYTLPNVQLSTHIAGAMNDEVRRQGDFTIEEFERYQSGQPLQYPEQLDLLDRLA